MTWQERINQAREAEGFTEEVEELANNYDTCAVAEFNGNTGHDGKHAKNRALDVLGMAFYGAVCVDDFDEAQDLYADIKRVCTQQGYI